jgi:hypothetical protein
MQVLSFSLSCPLAAESCHQKEEKEIAYKKYLGSFVLFF